MTFCLGIRVEDGLVAVADTRLTTGTEQVTAGKISLHRLGGRTIFLMTSGLRAARDKAVTYFAEELERLRRPPPRLHGAVELFAQQVRRVVRDDKWSLEGSGLQMNLHTLVGGELEDDGEPRLYLLYPQANWVEVARDSPYHCLGQSAYAKPLLDRALAFEAPLATALKLGVLAFDLTRTSVTDVGFPLDVALCRRGSGAVRVERLERDAVRETARWWRERQAAMVEEAPAPWIERLVPPAAEVVEWPSSRKDT